VTPNIGQWGRIPLELRELPQWVLAGADKAPLAVDAQGKLRHVSATRPSEWMSFELAITVAQAHRDLVTTHLTKEGVTVTRTGLDVGFVLHDSDEFSCVDLDVKDAETHPGKPELWTSADDFQRFVSIINTFHSYTERSRSGKGIHVWVKGNIGRGFHRDGVEVYSQERYIICTGDVYVDEPVHERGELLRNMVARMRPLAAAGKFQLEEHPPEADDWYIFQIAGTAANSDKFWQLWRGQWEGDFKTQSEADLALMSMFTFYSDSNSQCRSLFRASALGQREKAQKDDRYLDTTLRVIRERQSREQSAELSAIMASADTVAALRAAVMEAQRGAPAAEEPHREVLQLAEPGQGDPPQPCPPAASALAQLAPVPQRVADAGEQGIPWPPGFVGTLARFIYANSYLPIKEVSVVGALGMMAGLCGKAWHIPQSGLNLYIILVARSAIGKEAMHSGLAALVSHCQGKFPFFSNFVDFTEYVSGPALVKACLQNPSFVNVSGEWGRRLKRLAAEDGKEGPLQTLRTQMTNLYQKSGPQSIAGGLGYSNTEGSVASVAGVAYSMVGESTPGTFYEALTESMMEDGFLSRFLIVGYDGDRPDENPSMLEVPDDALVQALVDIAAQAHAQINKGSSMPLGRTEEAAQIMAQFTIEMRDKIRSTDDESRRQMWNRASLKALRVAALLAVGDHYLSPCINADHMRWAIELIRRDIEMMNKRLESGDVGSGDRARERKLVTIIRDYIQQARIPKSYRVPEQMHKDGLVPRSYLQIRTQQVASFYNHKLGCNRALDDALQTCITNGWLMECKGTAVVDGYGHHGKTYRVLDLPDYATQGDK
jgi:uncharacterized protein DUF3987